ncbi:hypothetical protein [Mycobacterium sp. GA-2829]|uniref:hypothetical protein n=1 Tax=Mycobacterium sp. GA-2829 TaxID=1772283 RepID=UPI0007401C63|nr:hypothetical protein [Mycobacterium sp. GA-2829]KUI36205.1 hypothetical protein AU194_15935 [Mycobacterium sp. GA-2829]
MDADPDTRYGPLAEMLCGQRILVGSADAGRSAHTDGSTLYLSADGCASDHRLEVIVQSALLVAGSLAPDMLRALVGRPDRARRYLLLEVSRFATAGRLPWRLLPWSELSLPATAHSTCARESLDMSRDKALPPATDPRLGELRPGWALARGGVRPPGWVGSRDLTRTPHELESGPEPDDETHSQDIPSALSWYNTGLDTSNPVSELFRKILGTRSGGPAQDGAGAEIAVSGARAGSGAPTSGKPSRYQVEASTPGDKSPTVVARWTYPEWDSAQGRLRPNWCHVHEVRPTTNMSDHVARRDLRRDTDLERRVAAIGLTHRPVRRQNQGDEIDLDAMVDLATDQLTASSDHGPGTHHDYRPYIGVRRRRRDLGAMVLVDISGSSAELSAAHAAESSSVAAEQIRTAATLATALHHIGDRMAAMAFHSMGRESCRALMLKDFNEHGVLRGMQALATLQPSGYSRIGAGIRHSCARLVEGAGTRHKLLIVISDGVPYDTGYIGRHAVTDVRHALDGCAAARVAVLWVCHGDMAPELADHLGNRPFALGSAPSHAQLRRQLPQLIERSIASAHDPGGLVSSLLRRSG